MYWKEMNLMANVKNAKKKIKQIIKTTKAHEQLKSTGHEEISLSSLSLS